MAHKRAAAGFHSIPASDINPKRTKVRDDMEISNDDVFHNMFSRLPANTLMRFRCVSMHFNTTISSFLNKLASHTKIKPKRTKMEISDDILCNILSRLPPNPLMRFRCVSMHWNSLISDPYFINSRSHPKILLSGACFSSHLDALDKKSHSMINLPSPIKNQKEHRHIIALGTLNGIVVLVRQNNYARNKFFLYNPLTGATKKIPNPPYPCCNRPAKIGELFGFGYGYGDDQNIIIGHSLYCCRHSQANYCDVFSFKKGSWTMINTWFQSRVYANKVGVFLNGFLHWIPVNLEHAQQMITALDVKKMVVSSIDLPYRSGGYHSYGLGTLHGCLCMINPIDNGFDVWVMKEQGVSDSWWKEYSFALALEYDYKSLHTICILEDGMIVVMDGPYRIVFCDPSKGSYNVFTNTYKLPIKVLIKVTGIEYIENLVSPDALCYV